jgi:16S rRNA (cytidine1402-2'-O)-methyltransferase
MPTDRFTFEGFLPRKPGERRRELQALAAEPRTMIFFESPSRLASSLADMGAAFGEDRGIAVCRELTKLYEEVRRGTASELASWAEGGVKGEIVVVVEGAAPVAASAEDAGAQVQALVDGGMRLKDACAEVAAATGLSSRDLYQQALASRLR